MTETKQANPQVKGGVIAYLQVEGGAMKAAEFYASAPLARRSPPHPPDEKGRTMHVHLYINGSSVMLGDPYPEYGVPLETPAAFTIMLQVDDIDARWQRAVERRRDGRHADLGNVLGRSLRPVERSVRREMVDESAQALTSIRRARRGYRMRTTQPGPEPCSPSRQPASQVARCAREP